jgi:transcription antitermination factor NusA-like protein
VPEIHDGVVEIKSISREAGSRTKLAVHTTDPNVDAVGACVGSRGNRVQNIVDELFGEKIDIINWSANPAEMIQSALSPAKVEKVILHESDKSATVVVPDYQLSLAIGKEGQNVRLAAKLCGWKIDIKSHTQYFPNGEPDPADALVAEPDPIIANEQAEQTIESETVKKAKKVSTVKEKKAKAVKSPIIDEMATVLVDPFKEESPFPAKKAKKRKTAEDVIE